MDVKRGKTKYSKKYSLRVEFTEVDIVKIRKLADHQGLNISGFFRQLVRKLYEEHELKYGKS